MVTIVRPDHRGFVLAWVLTRIRNGTFSAGMLLTADLVSNMIVEQEKVRLSRSPISTAMVILVDRGVLRLEHNVGYEVIRLDRDGVEEVVQVLTRMLPQAAKVAATPGTGFRMAAFERQLAVMCASGSGSNAGRQAAATVEAAAEIRTHILAGNELWRELIERVYDRMVATELELLASLPDYREGFWQCWESVVGAIVREQPVVAQTAMRRLIALILKYVND